MKILRSLAFACALLVCAGYAYAQQPLSGCWHPKDILKWTPESDPDAKFSVAKVPLATRFQEPTLMKANKNQYYEGQVTNATILYPTCSSNPAQGAYNFLGYQPTYWQYMDKLVYWAGSAGEGIINIPPAGSTDAAHQSGVKSLGNIFIPPAAFGGTLEMEQQLLTKENGKYVIAQKLYEIAKYFGFDGWFINEEYTVDSNLEEWKNFIADFYAAAEADGNDNMEIQWYNARQYPMTDILKTSPRTSQFMEYGASGDNRGYASELGCTEAETFSKLFNGIECVHRGLTGYAEDLDKSMPSTGHVGSVALFCPEEHIWKDNVKNLLGTSDATGEKAYAAMEKVFANENLTWVNAAGDPSDSTADWKGISGHVLERSVISSMPFESSFCVGIGKHRFVKGEKLATRDWYHSGVQSIMPTWRYWIENRGDLKVGIDWDDAYNFGNSLKVSGKLTSGSHLMRLYKTKIKISYGGTIKIAYKSNVSKPFKVKVATSSNPQARLEEVDLSTTQTENGWTVSSFDLDMLFGKTIYMIAIDLNPGMAVDDFELKLGELAVLSPMGVSNTSVDNFKVENNLGADEGSLRLTWDYDWTNDFDRFDIYLTTAQGRELVGQTRDEGFYIPNIKRSEVDEKVTVEVVPVSKDGSEGTIAKETAQFPVSQAPVVTISPSKSYCEVGEEVVLKAKGSGNPTAWKWTLPESLQLVSGSLTDQTITVKALALGMQQVTIDATNSVGTSSTQIDVIEVMSKEDMQTIYNVVLHKTVVDYSGSTNSDEVPAKIIDGETSPSNISDKWCASGNNFWAVFDLEGVYKVYGFKIFDCNAGPERSSNIDNYKIETSLDGKTWTKVVDETGRRSDNIKSDYIAPAKARYIRLNPYDDNGMIMRIWEFEVYGRSDNKMTISLSEDSIRLNAGESKNIIVSYNLNGDKNAGIECTATEDHNNLEIGQAVDNGDNTFTLPITAKSAIGESQLTIKMSNGGDYKQIKAIVIVDDPKAQNVLKGLDAEVRQYKADYNLGVDYDNFTTGKLTDGDTNANAFGDLESYSKYTNDFWTIFTAPKDKWRIAKVKIYIPDGNKGIDDNDHEGYVHKEISIMVGNDLNNMTAVKKFSDLKDVSTLEYIFPDFAECKYIALMCNVNAFAYPSMAEVEAYEQQYTTEAEYQPLDMQGWNADVVVEKKPSYEYSTDAVDDSYCFYSSSVEEYGSLCGSDLNIKTRDSIPYRLNALNENNSVLLKSTASVTLTLNEVQSADELYFLGTSSKNEGVLHVKVNYEDGTYDEADQTVKNWALDANDGTEALYGLGRISLFGSSTFWYEYNASLYTIAVPVNGAKRIVSVELSNNDDNSYIVVLAVAKKGRKMSTDIRSLDGTDQIKTVTGVYRLDGTKVEGLKSGINIIVFSDGSSRKVVVK